MKIECSYCDKKFIPTNKQTALINNFSTGKLKLIIIECPHCKNTFPFQTEIEENASNYKCPSPFCDGYVSDISDSTDYKYGCGECSVVWKEENDLLNSIEETN